MKILILTGTFSQIEHSKPTALQKVDGKLWLDLQIEKIKPLNCEIEIVLGKNNSEEILRNSLYTKECSIVYDPNEEESGLLSNLRAGLYSTYNTCLVIHSNMQVPRLGVFQKVIGKSFQLLDTQTDIIRPYCPQLGQMTPGFPLGITLKGKKKLLEHSEINSLNDSQIIEYKLPVLDQKIFAPLTQHSFCSENAG